MIFIENIIISKGEKKKIKKKKINKKPIAILIYR